MSKDSSGNKYEWVATSSATGWHAISIGGNTNRIGWVSPNYSKVEAA